MSKRPTFTSATRTTDMTHLRVIIITNVMSPIPLRAPFQSKLLRSSSLVMFPHIKRGDSPEEIKTEPVSVSLLFAGDQTLRVRLQQTIYSTDSSTATWEKERAGKPMPTSANIWEPVLSRSAALASPLARFCLYFSLIGFKGGFLQHSSHFLFKLKHPSYFISENHNNSISDLHEWHRADIRKLITVM